MNVKITILVENSAPAPGLVGEYGFSALIEVDGTRLLFDAGSNGALLQNSSTLKVKLDQLDGIIFSHGHFDHTGGIKPILPSAAPVPVYAHPRLFAPRPFLLNNGQSKEIGCMFSEEDLNKAGCKLIYIREFSELWPNVFLSGEIPRVTDYEDTGGDFKIEIDGNVSEDLLLDDMALIIKHPDGLVIISGCAHSGLINILEYARHMTGQPRVLAFVGGTHLMTASPGRMDKTINALKHMDIGRLVVAHCTGFYASARLYNELGDKVIKGETGAVIEF